MYGSCQGREHALYDAAHSRDANKRIGNEPCCNTRKNSGDAELEQRGRDPVMQKQARRDEHRWMENIYRVGATIEP